MKLKVVDGKLKLGSAYKLIAVGWFIGFTTVFSSLMILIFIFTLFGAPAELNGESVSGGTAALMIVPMLIMLPIVTAFHAVMFGGIITFGLWLYRRRKPIEIVQIEDHQTMVNPV